MVNIPYDDNVLSTSITSGSSEVILHAFTASIKTNCQAHARASIAIPSHVTPSHELQHVLLQCVPDYYSIAIALAIYLIASKLA